MNTSPVRFATCLSILALALAACSACSSSTALKKTPDAAVAADLGSGDWAGRDATDDIPSADTRAAADLASTGDVAKDLVTNETSTSDAWSASDVGSAVDAWPRDLLLPDLVADVSADHPLPCAPGMNQTCNDNLLVSSIWGTCQPDGTCLCTAGHVVNPNTGRCMMAPAKDASPSSDTDPVPARATIRPAAAAAVAAFNRARAATTRAWEKPSPPSRLRTWRPRARPIARSQVAA